MRLTGSAMVAIGFVSIALAGFATDRVGARSGFAAAPFGQETAKAVLEVVRGAEVRAFTLEDLRQMPATEGYGGIKSSTGKITAPSRFKGVAVDDLCRLAQGSDAALSIAVVASDGYEMTMPAAQVTGGAFKTYDVATGEERSGSGRLRLIVAYEMDGQPLDRTRDGTLRLGLVGPSSTLVTDGHWWVKWVVKVVVKPLVREWTLKLTGFLDEQIDRATFESCAAPKCHGARWTDSRGREWEGVALYLLAGRVDDEKRHDSGAFNRALNARGYSVRLVGRGGRAATIGSGAVGLNSRVVIAHRRDGQPLTEPDWPLRLVGPGVTPDLDVPGISEIRLLLPRAMSLPAR